METDEKYYLNIGRASEITDKKERRIYRFLEILPAFLSWMTIFLLVFLSWAQPFWMAIFIIAFDIYWLFKTIFLSLHMRSSFNKMKANLKRNWAEELNKLQWQDLRHLVILPLYQESLEVAKAGFLSLAQANYPPEKMLVVLSVEERGGEAAFNTAEELEREFGKKFFKFLLTKHPADIPGEMAGKGSNDAWAIKEAKEKIIDELKISYEKIIVSVFDVDPVVPPDFFN